MSLLSTDHPFQPACVWHDRQYDFLKPGQSTAAIDKIFYQKMLNIAGDNLWLGLQAKVFYQLARRYGQARWFYQKVSGLWE